MQTQFLGVRSVPLAEDTMGAWRAVGVVFRRRGRTQVWDSRFHEPHIQAVINLGNLDMRFEDVPVPIFNHPNTIRAISSPMALRQTLPEFIPEHTHKGPHWHKTNGFKGVGKTFFEKLRGECAVVGSDSQKHIEGTEYRVISVGEKVVQASKKKPMQDGWPPEPNGFEFEWVGVKGIKTLGIIPLVKEAIPLIPDGELSLIGWDIIVGSDKPYIIEANTSPGVNLPTAGRIAMQIREII